MFITCTYTYYNAILMDLNLINDNAHEASLATIHTFTLRELDHHTHMHTQLEEPVTLHSLESPVGSPRDWPE